MARKTTDAAVIDLGSSIDVATDGIDTSTPAELDLPVNEVPIEGDSVPIDFVEETLEPSQPLMDFRALLKLFPELEGAVDRLGFTSLTPVQAASLPYALSGENLIIKARTGSGKTLTYALPLLAHLQSSEYQRHTIGIVVTPTRELAVQVAEVLTTLKEGLEPVVLIGGASINAQLRAIEEDGRVVVGTPGRILDMIRREEISLAHCRFLALDEADEMLSMGFIEEVERILKALPRGVHGLFTSATLNERVKMLARTYLRRYRLIEVDASLDLLESTGKINHFFVKVGTGLLAKADALAKVLLQLKPRSAIVFCNTKSDTEFLEAVLTKRGLGACKINSDLAQSQRTKVIQDLRDGAIKVLIATDLAARGLDIDHVDVVVNYSLQDNPEAYVHRTGRTGRGGRTGSAVSIMGPVDFLTFHQLKRELKLEFNELVLEEALPA